ncbi:hypothetical protein pEaSNUABM29_00060 [Erwinia phage pEa_SNUABM_29]|nr:hypothetical protein pEaSNUABM29_00060 [Erwinia phage pEa_SNUABM_29]
MSLELDYITLEEDMDRLVALESMGAPITNPAIQAIRKRWCLDVGVAHEARDKSRTTSSLLSQMYNDLAGYFGTRYGEALKKLSDETAQLEKHCDQMESWLAKQATLDAKEAKSGSWTSKVCFEDVPDLPQCLKLANSADAIDAVVKQYTVVTRQIVTSPVVDRRKMENGELKKISYSSNAAIHRASGILGRFGEDDVEARPLAGNVIVVTRGEGDKAKVEFAVAHGGDYKSEIVSLNKAQCTQALKAVRTIIKSLEKRAAKNGALGYSGIYTELEKMKGEMKKMGGDELRVATRRFKNAVQLEDAFTTALARVADGLINWVGASLKANS